MSREERQEVLAEVDGVRWGKRRQLRVLGVPKSTYYRWKKPSQGAGERRWRQAWNRLTSEEEATVLAVAREMPEWRSRQLAAWLTDQKGLAVSESMVYRLLRREGLVKAAERQLLEGKEYQHKTTGPHQLWATDASYFRVVGWGYYYLVTVMDDFSRFFLAHKLQEDMTTDSLIEVVQETIDTTGMDDVPVQDRTNSSPTMGQATSPGPFGSTCGRWRSATSWPLLSTPRPAGTGAVPPYPEDRGEPGALQGRAGPGRGHRGFRGLLQPPTVSQGPGERDPCKCLAGAPGGYSGTEKGGAEGDFRAKEAVQSGCLGSH